MLQIQRQQIPRCARNDNDSRSIALPPQVHVFVRDWLSANNILLKSGDGHVLIDSGYIRHAPLTLALLASPRARRRAARAAREHAWPQRPHRRQRRDCGALRLPDRVAGSRGRSIPDLGREGAAARLLRPARRPLRRRRVSCRSDARLGRPRMARARGARSRHGRAGVPQPRARHPHLGRRAVGERLRAW